MEEIISHHDVAIVPTKVLLNRGKVYLSSLMKEVVKLLGINQTNTTPYHSQTDGLVEWFNHTLTTMLTRLLRIEVMIGIYKHFPYVLLAYQASELQST